MKDQKSEDELSFYDLPWDTDFFGVTCAKAILYKPVRLRDWNNLKEKFKKYQFISIENRNSDPLNAQIIGKDTSAFLADVNVRFKKILTAGDTDVDNVKIFSALERNEQIIEMAIFQFSKFVEDVELYKRNGEQVYCQWLINSFGKLDKYYALTKDQNGVVNGFLLHSYSGRTCTVELIAVSQSCGKSGIGTSLFKAVENAAYQRGCNEILVGTQVRNLRAINFYHKAGCTQVGCHQIYHLWNI